MKIALAIVVFILLLGFNFKKLMREQSKEIPTTHIREPRGKTSYTDPLTGDGFRLVRGKNEI